MYVGDDAVDVGFAVAGLARPSTGSKVSWYRPDGWRSATPNTTGAPSRSANTAGPRGVLANRPKNGTQVDARPTAP